MTQIKTDAQKEILELQRELMMKIMDYQIAYGAGTIGWNVSVSFVQKGA